MVLCTSAAEGGIGAASRGRPGQRFDCFDESVSCVNVHARVAVRHRSIWGRSGYGVLTVKLVYTNGPKILHPETFAMSDRWALPSSVFASAVIVLIFWAGTSAADVRSLYTMEGVAVDEAPILWRGTLSGHYIARFTCISGDA